MLITLACAVISQGGCSGWWDLSSRAPSDPVPLARSTAHEVASAYPLTLPGKQATRRGSYVFYHDTSWLPAETLLRELDTLPDELAEALQLPIGQTTIIQVFLFESQERYERYMKAHYPHLPIRRAYFLQEPRPGGRGDLKVFTWMGDQLHTDLRHELTHALLHGTLKDVPLWLDEGLASCFEWPGSQRGIHPQHLEHLRRHGVQPDLARLERLERVDEMEKPEYREAWAWTHFLLYGPPPARQLLREYVQQLRHNPRPGPLLPRLQQSFPDPAAALLDHLNQLDWPARHLSPPAQVQSSQVSPRNGQP
ncbi:MAG: DUF1570 domain-containing protein [Gemmataceae bacterium]|nr:DUF1570 domain-containing protein [Gemmataceae bacterium]MDW8242062.1 hypothetical protein [Thermogemmata sp.]